jgi:hypothetical protein
VCDVTMREPDADAAARFAASLALGLEALGVDPRDYAKRAAPSHLIWRVRKEPGERMILGANMLDPVGGVSHVRVVYPIQAMATDPLLVASVTDRMEVGQKGDPTPRIFVLHRPALVGEQGQGLLRRLIEARSLIVTEFDDLPDHFDMMRMGGALGFYGVHAVQTSTTAMADAIRAYHSEIAVFPNAMGSLAEVRNFAHPHTMTLFFGALNRERDWLPFMPAINAVAAMAGNRLRFQVVHDEAFFGALETPYKAFTPTCDYETYIRLLGGSEISFMPLADTRFNRAKSDLKFIEAGSCRVAALASSVVYGNSIEDGRTGLVFRDPVEFHARLLRLLAMPELARDLGDAARRYVADERMLAYQVAPRIAWYRHGGSACSIARPPEPGRFRLAMMAGSDGASWVDGASILRRLRKQPVPHIVAAVRAVPHVVLPIRQLGVAERLAGTQQTRHRAVPVQRDLVVLRAMDRPDRHIPQRRRGLRRIGGPLRTCQRHAGGEDMPLGAGLDVVVQQHLPGSHAAHRVAGDVDPVCVGGVTSSHLAQRGDAVVLTFVPFPLAAEIHQPAALVLGLVEHRHDHDTRMARPESLCVEPGVHLLAQPLPVVAHVELMQVQHHRVAPRGIVMIGQQHLVVQAVDLLAGPVRGLCGCPAPDTDTERRTQAGHRQATQSKNRTSSHQITPSRRHASRSDAA